MRHWHFLVAFSLATSAFAGCGEIRPTLYPVTGKVLVDGKPADRALVTFYAAEGPAGVKARSFALSKSDGSFRAFTFERDDGVPAGAYTLTVVLPQYGMDDDEPGPDLLEGRYADPRNSKLKVSVLERDNELSTFELTTTGP